VKVELSPRAKRELERMVDWWRAEHGEAPKAVFAELREAGRLLASFPEHGTRYALVRGRQVRRLLLRESQIHLYYRVDDSVVRVLAIWSTARRRAPRFGKP
jgi:plasmid stabilization system protein ParE